MPGRVGRVRRMPGSYAGDGDPVVDLELITRDGTHILTICSPFNGKIMRCRSVGELVHAGEHVIEVTGVGTPTWELFVAYRQNDAPGQAGRIGQALIEYFGPGQVFKDIESLEPGHDFASVIRENLLRAFAMVVVIGRKWIDDSRLQDVDDLHREEIRTALTRNIEIIPVCVDGASVPDRNKVPEDIRAFLGRIAVEMTETRWAFDIGRLQSRLEAVLANSPARRRFLDQVPEYQPGPRWQWIEDNPRD